MISKLDAIKALAEKLEGSLAQRHDRHSGRVIFRLEITQAERSELTDALYVAYGVEHREQLDVVKRKLEESK
jgi:hypothetical protein